MKENGQLEQLDLLAIFSTILGVMNYTENIKQTSNDDLLAELKHQNKDYMEKILEQNEKIIKLLEGVSLNAFT